ncbi:STAS/SEC14 domain-containing protein [Sagittula sp.]|uniref:STAS/SEC14 domain-containing protein n=1 Tax=Sagittula sp. TaxID=2038081 RepID=UPI00351618E5
MINITPLPPKGHYEVRMSGRIREDDYEDRLIPALDKAIEEHDRIRILTVIEDDAEFSIGAMLDDAELGMRHWKGFDRVAVVGKPGWMMRLVRGFGPVMPCPVRTFAPGEEDDARRWLQESLGAMHQTDLGDGVLHVQLVGKLDPAVMEEEERDMDAFVRANPRFRLLLDLTEFDGWQGLAALNQHFRIARNHYDLIDKAAVVGKASWQKLAARGLGHLSGAKVKHFDPDNLDAAKTWIKA